MLAYQVLTARLPLPHSAETVQHEDTISPPCHYLFKVSIHLRFTSGLQCSSQFLREIHGSLILLNVEMYLPATLLELGTVLY